MPFRFGWAVDYYGVSVSESQLGKVREYINNQDSHHAKISFEEEYQLFLKNHTDIWEGQD